MRILRVAQTVYPDVKGGAAYHIHALSRDQAARGHDVTVLTVRHDPELPAFEQRDGYTVVRYDQNISPLGNEISLGVAQYLKSATKFDVIHAHSHLYFSTNLAAVKRRFSDIPLALTNHGLYSQTAPEWVFDLYLKTLGRWTFNQADCVFCYTETDKQRVQELGVTSQITVVSNGIDTVRFSPAGPQSDFIESEAPVLLFVGRLVDGKQPEIAVEAFAAVRKSFPEAQLYLCGEGPLQEELEAQATALGVRDAVQFLGQLPYDAMPAVYRSADVLLLTSRAEGVPRTIMEALSSGLPVVSSDLPQIRAAFGEAVSFAESDDPIVFSKHACDLLHADLTVSLDAKFSWDRTVTETTQALESIVE